MSDKNNKAQRSGWQRVRLGDVVENVNSFFTDRSGEAIRYVAGEHIDEGDLKVRRSGLTSDEIIPPTFNRLFKAGDVLFHSRNIRKLAQPDFDGLTGEKLFVLRTKNQSKLSQDLLPFLLQTEHFRNYVEERWAGSTNKFLNKTPLMAYEFALPPMDEQQRLIRLLMSAEAAKTAAEDAATHLEKLRKSLLFETFDALQGDGVVRIPFLATEIDCRWVKARDAGQILMGRQLSPKYKTGKNTRKYLRVANVFDGFIDTSDVNEMDFNESEFATFRLQSGDVLLNEGQSRELVGRSAIFRDDIPDCCFQNTLIRFRPNAEVMSEFAHYYFQYCQYTSRFVQISKQTTSIAHLGVQRFAEMNFPLVSIDAQKAIVVALSAVVAAIPHLKKRAQAASTIRNQVLRGEASR